MGSEVAEVQAIAKSLGLKVHLQNIAFAGIIPALDSGRIDLTTLTDSTTRESSATFIDVNDIYFTFVVPAGNPKQIGSLTSLCGKGIALPQGVPQIPKVQGWSSDCTKAGQQPIKLMLFNDDSSALVAVKAGRADALLVDNVTGQKLAATAGGLQTAGHVLDSYAGFGIAKNNPQLEQAVQSAVATLIANGTIASIQKQYGVGYAILSKPLLNGAA